MQDLKTERGNNAYLQCKDHLVSGEQFKLVYEPSYDMLVTRPQPSLEKLPHYYESDDYISHTDSKKGIIPFLYQTVKQYSLRKKVSLITSLHKGCGSVLDVGAGTGDFLVQAKTKGWTTSGVEVNSQARNSAEEKGILLEESLSSFKNHQFDVITLWHVLEHIPDLKETIATLERLLKPNGYLIIAVPNFKSYDAKFYKAYWAAYDVPRHLWHFSQRSIPKLFLNFNLRKTKPMIFDAVYVSLLSEKYKTNVSFSVRAIFIGIWSNLKAIGNGEYSSLIYCLQKQKISK